MKKYQYETVVDDFLLTEEEEKIMRAMRRLDSMWKKYKDKPQGNRLILFCGGAGCSIRINKPSSDYELESYNNITNDGGDGADEFD